MFLEEVFSPGGVDMGLAALLEELSSCSDAEVLEHLGALSGTAPEKAGDRYSGGYLRQGKRATVRDFLAEIREFWPEYIRVGDLLNDSISRENLAAGLLGRLYPEYGGYESTSPDAPLFFAGPDGVVIDCSGGRISGDDGTALRVVYESNKKRYRLLRERYASNPAIVIKKGFPSESGGRIDGRIPDLLRLESGTAEGIINALKAVIRFRAPAVEVELGHTVDDMRLVPLLLRVLNPSYKFYLRGSTLWALDTGLRPAGFLSAENEPLARKKVCILRGDYSEHTEPSYWDAFAGALRELGCDVDIFYVHEDLETSYDIVLADGIWEGIPRQMEAINSPNGRPRSLLLMREDSRAIDARNWSDSTLAEYMDMFDTLAAGGRKMQRHLNAKIPGRLFHCIPTGFWEFLDRMETTPELSSGEVKNILFYAPSEEALELAKAGFSRASGALKGWEAFFQSDDSELPEDLAKFSLFVFIPQYLNSSIAPAALALCMGIPVITLEFDLDEEITSVCDGPSFSDEKSLAEAITHMCRREHDRASIATTARQKFSVRRVAERFLQMSANG